MFDPTAFENMRVVMEGALYDLDLDGTLKIIDRNDLVNTAKLSRAFDISFSLKHDDAVQCCFKLVAGLENLAAELLPSAQSDILSGAHIAIEFAVEHLNRPELHTKIANELALIWGEQRSIEQIVHINPFKNNELVNKTIHIHFNRLIFEEQIDDLVQMVDYMLLSLKKLLALL